MEKERAVFYQAKIKPNALNNEVVVGAGGELKVSLKAKPVEGEANQALIKILAEHFKVAKDQIIIKSGRASRLKLIKINY